jgi:hypothetical protein
VTVGGIVHTESKLRETAASYAKASGKDSRLWATGRRTVILDVELIGFRRKDCSGMRIISLDGDERSIFVLETESGGHDGVDRRNRRRFGCRYQEGPGEYETEAA